MSILKIGFVTFNVIFVLNNIVCVNGVRSLSVQDHQRKREELLRSEKLYSFGGDLVLTPDEEKANKIIMAEKLKLYENTFERPYSFLPSRHIFEAIKNINSTKLFQLLTLMPKGGILHAHDFSICSTDCVLSFTYKENLWQRKNDELDQPEFLFSRNKPRTRSNNQWTLVADERRSRGEREYDEYLRSLLTLYTTKGVNTHLDANKYYKPFINKFLMITPLLSYIEVFKEYFTQSLSEMVNDNVNYLEFRGTLPAVYDLDGNTFSETEVVQMYKDISEQFVRENPTFIGSRFIYSPIRDGGDRHVAEYIRIMTELNSKFPKYVIGFDLLGREDKGRQLKDLVGPLLSLPKSVNFYFHAGQTNWYGTSSDENLIDAVLLGTKRIGHGFALLKHPEVLKRVIKDAIAIEVNPISNQVLKLHQDFRNHPASVLFAGNYPVVISSDDPSFWGATPSTHDFFETFLGIAPKFADIRFLKKLVQSSIFYSSMEGRDLEDAQHIMRIRWSVWIRDMIRDN